MAKGIREIAERLPIRWAGLSPEAWIGAETHPSACLCDILHDVDANTLESYPLANLSAVGPLFRSSMGASGAAIWRVEWHTNRG